MTWHRNSAFGHRWMKRWRCSVSSWNMTSALVCHSYFSCFFCFNHFTLSLCLCHRLMLWVPPACLGQVISNLMRFPLQYVLHHLWYVQSFQRTRHDHHLHHHRPHDQQQQPQHFRKSVSAVSLFEYDIVVHILVTSNWDPCKCAWYSFAGVLDSRRKWKRNCGLHKLPLNGMPVPKWRRRQFATCRAWFYDLSCLSCLSCLSYR